MTIARLVLQIAFVVLQVVGLVSMLRKDIEGKPPQEPKGFPGVVRTLVVWSVIMAAFYFAGYYSQIVGVP